ncbi:MAG TPA: BamA/TamA family outer membrane protein [Bryobacteraceae bacterium]|nr:BamA/TamA family outer membrane protein [Bryobacteraceae bacterium]
MKHLVTTALLLASCGGLRAQDPPDTNVNERYRIESVDVVGVQRSRLSSAVRGQMQALVGEHFKEDRLDPILDRLLKDFPEYTVTRKVSRGEKPDHVKVVFEMELAGRGDRFDLSGPRALYHSRHGWTGELDATVRVSTSEFTVGILSDGDRLLERYAGVIARYENRSLGTDAVRLAFDFESLHQVWNGATLRALDNQQEIPGIYRTRQNFQPAVTVVPVRGLKATAGVSFQRFQQQFPAAHTEAANAVMGTLRYDRSLESTGPNSHRLGAGYGLRAATKTLESDYVYARHTAEADYELYHGAHKLSLRFNAGVMNGRAPLFERFVLGNSSTLRGWNKYDVAPLGGDRVVHNSTEYRYRVMRVFYDTGAVWKKGDEAEVKHSAGAGLQFGDFAMLVAFPIKNGRAVPVFMLGLNL